MRCRHGLSNEEKKSTSDSFKLHLELADLRNIEAVLIRFSSQNVGVDVTSIDSGLVVYTGTGTGHDQLELG